MEIKLKGKIKSLLIKPECAALNADSLEVSGGADCYHALARLAETGEQITLTLYTAEQKQHCVVGAPAFVRRLSIQSNGLKMIFDGMSFKPPHYAPIFAMMNSDYDTTFRVESTQGELEFDNDNKDSSDNDERG